MSRRLLPATIIPPDLYVERSADRQLREVITGMGRPGYILVARQMGKTNLLLNARRTLENSDLLFVYVDLSTKVTSLNRYYGLLIETAANVHPKLAAKIGIVVKDEYTPQEFEAVLRSILLAYAGRIVFVLDEIDSLANHEYSDLIFSQIRSMYFARSNYSEYNRLTYILSGVAEPSDLIKDKNVSPFNIGEKIYLNDFSADEVAVFLRKAGLTLQSDVVDKIFSWAGGNPRMTWDICSEIEIALEGGESVTSAEIDSIIDRIYLTNFDRPPVDHIRTIVQSDREIRTAVTKLISGDVSSVPDKIRNRLYLAGIIGMQSAATVTRPLRIKNRVLEKTLSSNWLADVEKQSRGLLQLARENYEDGRFEVALSFYEEYLAQSEMDARSLDTYKLGDVYFRTRRYAKAVDWFKQYLAARAASDELVELANFMLGRALIVLGDLDAAIKYLRDAVALPVRSSISMLARGFLASALLQKDADAYADEAETLSLEGLNEVSGSSGEQANRRNIKSSCLANLATIHEQKNDKRRAIELLEQAIVEGNVGYGPYLIMRLIDLYEPGERREFLLSELGPKIKALASAPADEKPDSAISQVLIPALVELRTNGREEEYVALLDYLESVGELLSADRHKTYTMLFEVASHKADPKSYQFLKDMIARCADAPMAQPDLLSAAKILLVRTRDLSFAGQYIKLRRADQSSPLDELDFLSAGLIAMESIRDENIWRLEALDDIAVRLCGTAMLPVRLVNGWFRYVELQRAVKLGRLKTIQEMARDIGVMLEDDKNSAVFNGALRKQMDSAVNSYLKPIKPTSPIVPLALKTGRNSWVSVKYADGRIVKQKYKSVQRDIALGNCTLLES